MIKKIAWDTFKNTGNINTFLEYKQIDNIEKEMQGKKNMNKNMEIDEQIKFQNKT